MIDYLHDGSFEGFLTCVHGHYHRERAAGIYTEEGYQPSLLWGSCRVEADEALAGTVYRAIGEKLGQETLEQTYRIHLSNRPDRYDLALRYLVLGFRTGPSVNALQGDPVVFEARTLARKVSFEAHRLTGLVRFSVLRTDPAQELLYGKLTPDHDVLELLGDHFADRFRNAPFVLHDLRRAKALFGQGGTWTIGPLGPVDTGAVSADETEFRRLWKLYYDHIAIAERTNPTCRRRFMPVRYWTHLTEMWYHPGGGA